MASKVKVHILKTLFEESAFSEKKAKLNDTSKTRLRKILQQNYGHKKSEFYKSLKYLEEKGLIKSFEYYGRKYVYIPKKVLDFAAVAVKYENVFFTFLLMSRSLILRKIKEIREGKPDTINLRRFAKEK